MILNVAKSKARSLFYVKLLFKYDNKDNTVDINKY